KLADVVAQRGEAAQKKVHGVSAREDEPIVAVEILKRLIERRVRLRLDDLDGRAGDDARAIGFKARGKFAGLRACARDDDGATGKGLRRGHVQVSLTSYCWRASTSSRPASRRSAPCARKLAASAAPAVSARVTSSS